MRVNPFTFEIVNNALIGVADQMAATILRTSYSTVVREMLDYSTAVFDPQGHIIAQSCRIPIHLNSMSRSLRTTLEGIIPIEEWNEGDIIITNDPYLGGQHLPDVQTFMPVFVGGEIVAICGTLDHHLDVGGMRPGSYAGDAVEIFQEGLRIPPFKLFEKGEANKRFLAIFDANVRQPEQTGGDLRAQAAALSIGRDGVLELVERYGRETFEDCLLDAIDISEARMRAKIRELPEGEYSGEYWVDDDGITDERIKIKVKLTIKDGTIHVDFEGTDKQRRAPTNATISSTESATYFSILSILDPTISANYGLYKPISIFAPTGTVVNAESPAPVVGRNTICHTIVSAIMMALSKVVPERVTAGYYANSNVHILSGDGTGDIPPWILFDIEVGGGGARLTKDGVDCWSQGIHNLANTPIEMIEAMYPLQFTCYEFLEDTGGAGRTRGGLGVRRDIRFLDKSGTLETQFDKFKVEPFGLEGGMPGATGKLFLNPDSNSPLPLRSKTMNQRMVKDDIFSMFTQGGGGYGSPTERNQEAIRRDVVEGKLTPERAQADYGVKVDVK
ncbi:hydantoinase B/oxoprolinase family protein [Chelativorans sp. ZYF759]|uniref:hydantoinase B/oxoprolinase family protein n=1 Tax=Chelativorans sp. ZYF759 TaxID=2692213 RepID=UPI00145F4E78|nr:hydantoinase B/oxoprolinase family protein [Chelativorans sp. ZYF759]NMG41465.1 hydantoinase B/oxoprolinase family protein [Chelativorans sp. ZYF759]